MSEPERLDEVSRWLGYAGEDLRAARALMKLDYQVSGVSRSRTSSRRFTIAPLADRLQVGHSAESQTPQVLPRRSAASREAAQGRRSCGRRPGSPDGLSGSRTPREVYLRPPAAGQA